jgi:hypothetical protein
MTVLQIHCPLRQYDITLHLKEYKSVVSLATTFYDKAIHEADFDISNHTTVAVYIYAKFSIISSIK